MATNYNAVAVSEFPVEYQCSKCGTKNRASIQLRAEESVTIPDLASKRRSLELMEQAQLEASHGLKNKIFECYRTDPIRQAGNIKGKCASCGNREKWMRDPVKYWLGMVVATLYIVAVLAVEVYLYLGGYKTPVLIAVPVAAFAALMIANKIHGAVKNRKLDELCKLPPEQKPHFVLDVKEVTRGVSEELEKKLEELRQ